MTRSAGIPRRWAAASLLVLVQLTGAAVVSACSAPDAGQAEAVRTDLPEGLTAYLDQRRSARKTRTVIIRLVNEPEREVTVESMVVRAERFETVRMDGDQTFQNEADFEFDLPRGTCGKGASAEVEFTYRLDGGERRMSTTTATDRYGAVGYFLDRDCAERTLREAADVELGEVSVTGTGRASRLRIPVTMTPTGARDDVAFGGFDGTPLFRVGNRWGRAGVAVPFRDGGAAVPVVLEILPARCDPHALAEDKIGTLFGVRVTAEDLGPDAQFYLPITEDQRAALYDFWSFNCGFDT